MAAFLFAYRFHLSGCARYEFVQGFDYVHVVPKELADLAEADFSMV